MPCAIEMLVRILVAAYCEVEKAKIVFDTSEITCVARLFEVETGGCVLDQGLINMIVMVVGRDELCKQRGKAVVKTPFNGVIFACLQKRCDFIVEVKGFTQLPRVDLNYS